MKKILGVTIFCLVLAGSAVNAVSDLPCDHADLRTMMLHVRQTHMEYTQLYDTIKQVHQELNTSQTTLKAIESKLNQTEKANAARQLLVDELQIKTNECRIENANQQQLIQSLQDQVTTLRELLNRSEATYFEQSFLIGELTRQANESESKERIQEDRLVNLESEFSNTNELVGNLKTNIVELNKTIKNTEMQVAFIREYSSETFKVSALASTYVTWGRTSCRNNDTETVYTGYTAGSPFELDGGAASYICVPQNPTWASFTDGIQNYGGLLAGTEYEIWSDSFKSLTKSLRDNDAPCSVCRTPRPTTIMIPGRTECPSDWTLEYTGYLMTGYSTHTGGTDYVCVDYDAEAVPGGNSNMNGKLLYFTEVRCGSLPCQEYPNGREVACAVCSK